MEGPYIINTECQFTPPPSYDAGRGPFAQSWDGSEFLLRLDSAILDPAVVNGSHHHTVYGILYTANGPQYRIDNAAISG